jgi:hypothetical protein
MFRTGHEDLPATSRIGWLAAWIASWLIAIFTGTAASPNYLVMVTISLACAIIHLWCALRLRHAGVREWVLWILGLPLGLLSIESLWRLVGILRSLIA